MSRKSVNEGLDLSLTGSHISTTPSIRSRPGSAKSNGKRPIHTTHNREKASLSVVNGLSKDSGHQTQEKGRQRSSSSHSLPLSARSERAESARSKTSQPIGKASSKDDFMALFDSRSSQARIGKSKQPSRSNATQNKPKKAWGSDVLSARSGHSVDSEGDNSSKMTKDSRFSHSVFQPLSARTTSTVDEDYQNHNFDDLPPTSRDNLDILSPRDELENKYLAEDMRFEVGQASSHEELHQSRNSPQGDGFGVGLLGQSSSGALKIQNLNSIANNMTSLAMSPGTKTPLVNIENSYQNIKPKTPVNQVRQSPNPHLQQSSVQSHTKAEDHIKKCNMAATQIQRWYRRHSARGQAGQAAMRRLLDHKRQEKEQQMRQEGGDYLRGKGRREAEDRKRAREEKARLARQQAISELQKKREEKRQVNKEIAEEEIRYLQSSGKITRQPVHQQHKSSNVQQPKSKMKAGAGVNSVVRSNSRVNSDSDDGDNKDSHSNGNLVRSQPSTSRSTGRKLDDIFQNNSPCHNSRSNDLRSDEEEGAGTLAGPDSSRSALRGSENVDGATSQAATKTTLEDLMETLKKLEEEEKMPTARKDKNETPHNWLDDLDRERSDEENDLLTADRLQQLHPSKDNLKKSGYLTDEKLRSIMSFLDEVETHERLEDLDQEISRTNQGLDLPAPLVPSGTELAQLEQASAHAAEVTNTVLSQRMQLDEKNRTVQILQKALNQQRELTVRHAKETEREMKKRLDIQKDEYEETIKRHLGFIDQLIDDKKALGEKCEQLVKEMKTVDKKYQDRIKALTENYQIELQNIRELHIAAEKLRRERWIDEKTRKIKEMTVKGLEPEIQRLIAKHKSEVKKLKSIHEAELLAADERAGQRYITMTEELRDQLAKEKEKACARERELARQTYEKQMQQEEEALQAQRRRLFAEVQEEKERLQVQASRQRQEMDRHQRQVEESQTSAAEAMKREYETAREEQERRHSTEIRQLKEQLAVEKAAWEENYMKKQETWLLTKERELKETVRKDRDKEIELVITRLEEDSQSQREECERLAENRIKRVRDKYESEMAELERSERLTTEKYNQIKAKLAEVEGEYERSKVVLRQKDKEIEELKSLLDKLNTERSQVSDVVRQEFADRIVATEEENRRIKTEMSELRARHKLELERAKVEVDVALKSKQEEMDEVHKRVKQAMVKKEEVVNQLRQQYQAAQKRADHLEGLLDQQRRQLLSKK